MFTKAPNPAYGAMFRSSVAQFSDQLCSDKKKVLQREMV